MEKLAHGATVVGAIFAVVTFWIGLGQFTKTQELARENLRLQAETLDRQIAAWGLEQEAKTVDLYLKFNELKEELATKPLPASKKEAQYWRHNRLLGITEMVFRLTENDAGWQKTVGLMIESQTPFLTRIEFACDTFAERFKARLLAEVKGFRCETK